MDRCIIYKRERWILSTLITIIYIFRIINIGGCYIISYMLGLYILHSFVQFVTPKGLPDIEEDDYEGKFDSLPLSNK